MLYLKENYRKWKPCSNNINLYNKWEGNKLKNLKTLYLYNLKYENLEPIENNKITETLKIETLFWHQQWRCVYMYNWKYCSNPTWNVVNRKKK